MSTNANLIQCGDHQWAPWSIVCIHLIEGTSKDWQRVNLNENDLREVDGDWLCPGCMEKHKAGADDLELLKAICMHCVRKIRKRHGV